MGLALDAAVVFATAAAAAAYLLTHSNPNPNTNPILIILTFTQTCGGLHQSVMGCLVTWEMVV